MTAIISGNNNNYNSATKQHTHSCFSSPPHTDSFSFNHSQCKFFTFSPCVSKSHTHTHTHKHTSCNYCLRQILVTKYSHWLSVRSSLLKIWVTKTRKCKTRLSLPLGWSRHRPRESSIVVYGLEVVNTLFAYIVW